MEPKKNQHSDTVMIWSLVVMLAAAGGYAAGWWTGGQVLFWLFAFLVEGLAVRVLLWLFR